MRNQIQPKVCIAEEKDIQHCYNLELRLHEGRPEAQKEGFLLSGGDAIESYIEYQKLGSFWVVRAQSGIIGFLFALPPDSDRMQRLVEMRAKFVLNPGYEDAFDRKPIAWVGKVGVEPNHMRKGVASALYQTLLSQHSDWNLMTTTVMAPICNTPSVRLQRHFDFEAIGTLPMGDRGSLKGIVCQVHFRAASSGR